MRYDYWLDATKKKNEKNCVLRSEGETIWQTGPSLAKEAQFGKGAQFGKKKCQRGSEK